MTAAHQGRIVAIVVTHNRLEHLKVTVARLLRVPPEALAAVVVIDNASTDGTTGWLAEQADPRLDIVTSTQNCGGAGGFAQGMSRAMAAHDPDWLLLMDDDARPLDGAIEMFHGLDLTDCEALAAAVYYPDGRICEMNRPSRNPFWSPRLFLKTLLRGRDGYHIPYEDYERELPRPIDLTSFVGFFVPKSVVEEAGLPQSQLFLYGDDVIYTLGLRRRGVRIAFDPRIKFEHDCETFEDDKKRRFRPLWKAYYSYRNGLMMYHLAAGLFFWLMVPVLYAAWAARSRRYGADQGRYLRLMHHAVLDGILGRAERTHVEVMALAEGREPVTGSEYPGDSASKE